MPKEHKIYTKTGDLGETSLLGGKRVWKSHERVEAYGTLDELNSFIGLLKDQQIGEHYKSILATIQEKIFVAEAWIASDPQGKPATLPFLTDEDIKLLENEIDEMNKSLPLLNHFLLPGGHTMVSYCHIARTVCCRAERTVIRLKEKSQMDQIITRYLNRLSDYFFVLARKIAKDLGATENQWVTKT
ncbi:MAG: cob(I)yrinic acid a,c-diamide adenosyltransferase [Bacteroidetes bacterium]|nr:cob(I)yrinic acid a,c-diamide adenosyltransferase [Bacteroidota bacterium]